MVITELPFTAKWEIKESKLLRLRNKEDKKHKSKPFSITSNSNSRYHLSICPNRNGVDIFVHVEIGDHKEIECKAKIIVKTAEICKDFQHTYKKSDRHHIRYCSANELFDSAKRFFVDGVMTIKVKGTFKLDDNSSTDDSIFNADKKAKLVGQLMWDRDDKDISIFAKNKEIKVHKYILVTHSPAFEGMFNNNQCIETQTNKVDIPNYSFEAVEIVVKLCYDLDVPGDHVIEHCNDLCEFLEQYQMKAFLEMIQSYFHKTLSPLNVCSRLHSAIASKNSKLSDFSFDYLLKCLKESTAVANLDILDQKTTVKALQNLSTKDI